ncbi:hypothetical protein VOLCADRAFT_92353 [Volvox carteri f. nagariensis]|uniref:Fibrocystin-L n=1 Tax=Volvox carteri f. nagariensis TaxID=3068 RepID=D8TZG0_VOLCA|nr:uncharacterized protein VOLCADRAFT_92353 [Volvox carteri f. nagariensis]EFJ47176.1 hypothetical protein VOLCADRAFT_92353 [Volvox carteri f. nagariensis]|eukprot:XP_002951725.1 hypothetical protein VOLCADRAFT_92353 [Volvox carteri f. nagariensis]
MLALRLTLLAFLAGLLYRAVGQPVINRVDPSVGSLAGGTRLVIYGNNFGDMYTTSSSVYVGPYPCNLISHYSSSEVLTCETSPGSAGTYLVYVSVGDYEPAMYGGFTYTNDITPTLKAVLPRAGPPGADVFIYGDRTWYMAYRDCIESNWGDTSCVGSILFGDYLCRQDPADQDSPIIMTTNQRLGGYLYRIGCTMPAQDSNNTQPALGTAAKLNATIHFEASMRGGAPTALPSSFLYDVDSVPYQFQLYPEVTGVSPATGSNAGGTLVKVTGRGFPDLMLDLNDTIAISIAGVPCDIVNSTYDTLFCVTGPKPAATASPIGGLYPAMRGIEYEFYNGSRLSYGNLWQLNNTIKVQALNGSYRAVLTGSWEGNEYSTPYYCSRSKAFFTAPRAGNYSFYMSADDYAQLNGTWKQSNGALVSTTLINLQSWTYIDNFFQYASQRSPEVTLSAGQSILLEMNHCNGPSVGAPQLAVRMPVPEPRLNSLSEIQKISISATFFPRSVAIKYLYGAGAAMTAFNITISALNDTALDDPQIGLYVQINGGWDIVLPLGATTGAMDDLVEASLGGNFTKNDTLFGIRKTRAYGTLTLQMAALDGSMGSFDVTAARLVLLPPPPPPMANTCPSNSSTAINVTSIYPPPAPEALQSVGTGFAVVVSRAQAVPAVVPTGDFLLGLYGSVNTYNVSATSNSTAMVAAIQNVTGYNSYYYSVNVADTREGAYFARIWNITFTYSWLDNVPALVVGPSSTTPPGALLAMESRSASPRLQGSFKVAFGSSCASVKINLGDSSETIKAALGSLPGLAPPKQVDVSGDGTSGYVYTITFDPINNPGDQPELRIADASDLQGVNPTGSITTVWNGTTDAFYAPIPTEFLRLAVSQPGTINLQVNGVPSACADASGICGFLYSDAATPRITGVSPTRLAFSSQASLPLTITGSGFSSGPSVEEYCWSLPETARARCDATGSATCNFGYSTELTPAVDYLYPSSGSLGTRITVVGSYLDTVTEVQFLQGGVLKGTGSNVDTTSMYVFCDAPDLPPGVYTILLLKANGEKSVDPYGKGTFTFTASIDSVTSNVGSLAGGLPLVLSVGGAGLAVGPDNLTANAITIADLPCPILSVKDRTEVTCRAPGINGYVSAEYWNLGVSTFSMPDIFSFTKPRISRIEKGTSFSWGTKSPEPGVINLDYWAARFTFYYQISVTENVTFYMYADDDARLYIDDVLLGGRYTPLDTILYPGMRKMVITYVEYTSMASLSVLVSRRQPDGSRGPFANLEWQKVTPVPPGTPLPVKLTVNGIDSVTQCPVTNLTVVLPGQPKAPFEPSWVQTPNTTCSYVYSICRTPSLSILSGITLSGIMQPTFNSTNTTLSIFGDFLTDPSLPAASQISVTLANQLCSIVGVAPVTVNGTNTTNINCTAPALPAGQWPVSIMVEGLGLTRPTATAATDLPIVTYTVRVLNYTFNNPNSKCYFSLFGGGTFNITGYGFVKDLVDTTLQVNMTAAWETVFCGSGFSNSPPCQAVNSSRLNLVPLASDGFTASFGLTRFKVPNPEAFAGNNSISGVNLRYKPRVYYTSNGTYAATAGAELLYFCGGRTPALSGVTPLSAPPDAGATLSLTWYLSGVGTLNNTITAPAAKNGASNATVEFEVGPTVLPCRNPVVTDFNITSTTYREAISCTMQTYMPAATYTLWLCIQPFGCGLLPAYTVPLTITAMSATTGGSAGGITVVITGKGFDTNTTLVSVRFGNSTCKVISSTATSLTCVTGPLDTKPVSPVTWPLSITPTAGTNETTLSSFTFTFDPALESTVSGIVPARGSTEGGTPVTITGADFRTGVSTTVSIGDVACQSVVVVNSTAITCTTGKPPNSILRVPLPVTVLQQGRGYARSSAQYQYIDVWSRNSTWGGGPLPGYEDSVVIPAGVTVLLDISPPKLYVIVLEGNLVFDDTKDYINLQAHYIIVKGGNFTIGSAEKPYPGRANITMHGAPNSRDLPMYGAKALAVRQGDGIESGNLIEGNLAIHVKVSDALLNTDTTPAAFWITNPNNTVRNNVAAGSAAYGYWYRMLDNPEGPSYTTTICPKFTPLLEFTNNTAHSSMFYGLRIHPEFYPRNIPCNGFSGTFEQVPAVFNGLVAYKNGMKGAVGTQVGLVQLVNVITGDNGGGPKQHVVNGKDHGGDLELSWVVDDRSRVGLQITEMAGIVNATIYARTSVGKRGNAGQWPSCRRVAGIITQSPVLGDSKHSALMSLINVTFVDFKGWDDCTLFSMLEACGKCKTFQGGSTTFTANISIITSDNSSSMMSYWSWGHQGVYLDTDGTLLNNKSLPASLLPNVGTNVTLGPGATWHSSVESELFDPNECKYVRNTRTSNNGAYCSPGLSFRRVMLHGHTPESIMFKDLILTSLATNRTSLVHFTKYNENGYQFTVATTRDYWVQWDMPFRFDPDTYQLHKMDLMNTSDYVYITTKHIQVKDHFTINNNDQWNNLTAMPPPTNSTHGMFYYNKTKAPNSWWWSNRTYNDTKFTVFLDGRLDTTLDMKAFTCPNTGCSNVPDAVVDIRDGTLYWSNTSTWNTSAVNNFRKPVAGDNVTIPYGWDLVIDESPPPLLALTVQGNLRFDTTRDINLTATYIIVMGQGVLSAGSATEPHPAKATIRLNGARDTPDYGIDNNLNLGSKVLAALSGGTINLYGKPARKRWIKCNSSDKMWAGKVLGLYRYRSPLNRDKFDVVLEVEWHAPLLGNNSDAEVAVNQFMNVPLVDTRAAISGRPVCSFKKLQLHAGGWLGGPAAADPMGEVTVAAH